MTTTNSISRLRAGLHPSVSQSLPEIKYVLRTLLRLAGFGVEFVWANGDQENGGLDLYYGPANAGTAAQVEIHWYGLKFYDAPQLEPARFAEQSGLAFLDFGSGGGCDHPAAGRLRFTNDIIFGSYWLLTGARETAYRRDRVDNLHLDDSFFLKHDLASRPLVSEYAAVLRQQFAAHGRAALALPWSGRSAAFAFTHDVDYPQIIRSIESARLLVFRGVKALPSITGILKGTNHFWKFAEWVEFERTLGTRPTFYFLAKKGSLAQYAMGTPDGFYDIRKPEFTSLFRQLREQGCEIGLHASYNAHRSAHQLRHEKEALEQAAGVKVEGNRHHYWHLDPAAPHETLRRQEQAGLVYDSSLGFEFYPGFRRGVCHPFRPYHPQERRELNLVELPPTWMDDHFDRRLAVNGIADPTDFARKLVHTASKLGGTIVVDYHLRGMNADVYPRYGAWLSEFVRSELGSTVSYQSAAEIVHRYRDYEQSLNDCSLDLTAAANERIAPALAAERDTAVPEAIRADLLRPEEHEAWDAFVSSHAQGSIYHTLAWKAVTEEAFGHKAVYLRAVDSAGTIVGVLPLFFVSGIFGGRLVSVPLRDRGGPLFLYPEACRVLAQRALALQHDMGAKSLEIKYPSQDCGAALGALGYEEERYWVTTVVPLNGDSEKMWNETLRSPTRRAVKKARNAGLECRWSHSSADLDTFYHLFVATRKGLGIPPYPKRLFSAIERHLFHCGLARLLMVERAGRPVAALIVMTFNGEMISGYMGYDNASSENRPNDLLFWEAMRWASDNGYRTYYFGADSPLQDGLLTYKKKWGGESFPIPYYRFPAGQLSEETKDSSAARYDLYRRMISWMPTPVLRLAGSLLANQIS